MTMRLHTSPRSPHARRVAMAIHELGLDSDIKVLDFGKGEHKEGAYLAHNPNGKVPTLEDNGFWLWESNAILCYLADKKPEKNLYPTETRARADVNRWLFWESSHMGAACAGLTAERVVKPMLMKTPGDPALVAYHEANYKRYAAVLNGQLEGKQWVTGHFSIADLSLASAFTYAAPAQLSTESFRHLHAWLERMQSRDSWKRTTPPM